jgi:phosphate transport system permease protein
MALGASPVQVVFHQVLPAALPGTLTGTIIGMAQALGETAPLLMIGMVAFIASIPASPMDSSAALPVQIYLWAESAERGFVEKTAAAIIVIMGFLILMNMIAVIIRSRTQTKVE